MCQLEVDLSKLEARFGAAADILKPEIEAVLAEEPASWLVKTDAGFKVTEAGRPFLRLLAARFDTYLPRGAGRHSSAM